ncbi:MAG: hypothetical protein KDD99_23415, partial [Bacteroidetes bacterium]|nr:hypothetical protein [Bacteroidota bacterium]
NVLYGFAENPGKKYSIVFFGNLKNGLYECKWFSVPKYGQSQQGSLSFQIFQEGKELRVKSQTGGFPGRTLRATILRNIGTSLPEATKGSFAASSRNDLDGAWSCSDGATYYVRQVNDVVVWFGEAPFAGGQPVYAHVFVGKRVGDKVNGYLVDLPKGGTNNAFDFSVVVTETHRIQQPDGGRIWNRIGEQPQARNNVQTRPGGGTTPATHSQGKNTPNSSDKKNSRPSMALLTVMLPDCEANDCSSLPVLIQSISKPELYTISIPNKEGNTGKVIVSVTPGTYQISIDGKMDPLPYESKMLTLSAGQKVRVTLVQN